MAVYDFFLSRNSAPVGSEYIGHNGRLFYDENEKVIRYSDGVTPGGFVINPITTVVSTVEPTNVPEGVFWLDPETLALSCYHDGEFIPTIDTATESKIGGIKLGPGVTVNPEGQLIIDTAGLEFSFGDFYAFTNPGPSDGACLSSINDDQDVNLVSNGTGSVNIIGEFHIHKTNADVEGALSADPIFSVDSVGQVKIVCSALDANLGAVEIVGSTTGNIQSPVNTGVMLHITGNTDDESRLYNDAIGGYSGFVGRRFNGTALSPTQVLENEEVTRLAANAYKTGGWSGVGGSNIRFVSTDNQTNTTQGMKIDFYSTPKGSSTSAIVKTLSLDGATATFNAAVTISAGTATSAPLKFTSGTNLTTAVAGSVEYDGTVIYGTPVDQERGIVVTEQKYILNAERPLNNNLVSQSLFGAGFHVTGGVRYRYQILCTITKTAGNSVSIGYGFLVNGGGALAKHTYRVQTTVGASALTPTPVYAMHNSVTANFATPVNITGPLTNGASGSIFDIQGVIEVTTSGYVTPQVTFLANAPTGAALSANATIRVFPVGPTGANTVIGNWI